jgi:beta-mannosidase
MTSQHRGLERRELHEGWNLTVAAGPAPAEVVSAVVPASVPGSVHTDLLAAGLIPDPYLDDNESLLAWVGLCDWRYSLDFDWTSGNSDRVDLVFAGLDTIADVELNGTLISSTRNMHRSYRCAVAPQLREGANSLVVTFRSPVRFADSASLELGYRPHVNHHPYNAIRKMACSFGWDWGIDTASSGMWRPVALESWSVARLAEVRPVAFVDGADGVLETHVRVERSATKELAVSVTVAGIETSASIPVGADSVVVRTVVPAVDLWWPRTHGAQPMYDVTVTLGESDAVTRRVGFRTVAFDTTPDAEGTPFTILVNGEPIVIRGANWIPDDAFPHRVDRARYERRLDQAAFANLNLIRVWGGGIYESDDFYDACDERGLLTWQDFLLACAAYAEEEPMLSEFEAEAREAVARISTHPSLILFNGNNENVWGYEEWNWQARLEGKTWGAGYYYELFPQIVAELAPHVKYTPASPFSPVEGKAQNDPAHGSMHIWDLWNQKDYPEYRSYRPRFVSEFGWQGPPTWSTLTQSLHDEPLTPESPGMLVHQKAMEGNAKLTDGLVAHLPLPNTMADWHWAMQLNQAIAIRTAIEWFRSLQPHCMGNIVWQLNDCWPVTSWAAVDGYERPKPLLYALRGANADRLLTIQPAADGLELVIVNDTALPWAGPLTIRRLNFVGTELAVEQHDITVAARSSQRLSIPSSIATAGNEFAELIRAELGGTLSHWFFAEMRDSELVTEAPSVAAELIEGGWELTVTATVLTRELSVLVDKVDPNAVADASLVTLLPGESVVIRVTGASAARAQDFEHPQVLRSANQLVTG